MNSPAVPPIGGVFGGGGIFGIGYAMGIIDGLATMGISLKDAPLLGTSAGSWAAAAVALDIPFQELVKMDVPQIPDFKKNLLADSARALIGEHRDERVHVMACALPLFKRTEFSGADYPLADLIAASSSVPGLFKPHRIDGTSYVDGGVRSGTSVDFGPAAQRLIVIAPLAGAMWGPAASLVDKGMHGEVMRWEKKHGGETVLFTPVDSAAHLAQRPKHLFDKNVAIATYHLAVDQVRKWSTSVNL